MPTTETLSEYEKERGKPMPSWNHSMTQKNLIVALARYEPEHTVASELTLDLEGMTGDVTPDLSIYGQTTTDYAHDEVRIERPPLLAIEIVSPSQSTQEVVDKIHAMLKAGVQSCWLVQPAMQTVTVYREGAKPQTFSEGVIEDPVLEDIEVEVGEVFH